MTDVASRGKHLLVRTDRRLTLHTHFGMDGSWELIRAGARWPSRRDEVRVVLETDARTAVGIRLKITELLRTEEEAHALAHLGPDVLGPDWDADEALRRLQEEPDRPVGVALLDQRVMGGLGNVFRCELCFLIGADPLSPVGAVADLPRAIELARELVTANRDNPDQVATGDPRAGHSHWVYGRAGQACRRCGSMIERRKADVDPSGRVTYWCPSCQKFKSLEAVSDSPRRPSPN